MLAHAGVASRRACEEYITAGRVRVNGKVVTELGTRVRPDIDIVEVDGQPVVAQEHKLVYYLLNKPIGYLSTVSDPHGRPTALSLVSSEERLYPVGRLDLDSEGLLLFTNDGDLAYRLMHPRYQHEREYLVLVVGEVSEEARERLERGVPIGERQTHARAEVRRLPPTFRWRDDPTPPDCTWLQVTLREGQKRQIRYMLEVVEHPVRRLIRVRMGNLRLGGLEAGAGRWLSREESRGLRRDVGLERAPAPRGPAVRRAPEGRQTHPGRRAAGGRLGRDHDRH